MSYSRRPSSIAGVLLAVILGGIGQRVDASSFLSFDPRTMAMGSTGVATARPYNAFAYNPAMITGNGEQRRRHFGRVFAGARIFDRDNFIDSVSDYQDNNNEQEFSLAIDNLNQALDDRTATLADLDRALDATDALVADITSLSDKPLRIAGAAGFSAGYAGPGYAAAFSARRIAVAGSIINISHEDVAAIEGTTGFLRTIQASLESNTIPSGVRIPDPVEDFTSTVTLEGGLISEYGITLGMRPAMGPWRLGATLKRVRFTTVDYQVRIQDAEADAFYWREHQLETRFGNVDAGLSWEHEAWRIGVVGRNLVAHDVRTVRGNRIELRPTWRLGVAHETRHTTLTADLDLTRNEPLGFDDDTLYIAVGSEARIWENTALRFGFRHNLVNAENTPSFGFGIGPPQAHFDIAVMERHNQAALSLQFGMHL